MIHHNGQWYGISLLSDQENFTLSELQHGSLIKNSSLTHIFTSTLWMPCNKRLLHICLRLANSSWLHLWTKHYISWWAFKVVYSKSRRNITNLVDSQSSVQCMPLRIKKSIQSTLFLILKDIQCKIATKNYPLVGFSHVLKLLWSAKCFFAYLKYKMLC